MIFLSDLGSVKNLNNRKSCNNGLGILNTMNVHDLDDRLIKFGSGTFNGNI